MVLRAVLALIAGAAMLYAVGSLWERSPTEGPGPGVPEQAPPGPTPAEGSRLTFTPPPSEPWPLYQPPALFPAAGGSQWGAGVTPPAYPLPEHDPLTAYVTDIAFNPYAPKPAPSPEPLVSAAQHALSEADARAVLTEAGWPVDLHDQALAVACGIGNQSGFPNGESGCRPGAVGDGGNSLGFFQLWYGWARYCGIPIDALMDALENARCAFRVYLYDIGKGYAPWEQWSVKP